MPLSIRTDTICHITLVKYIKLLIKVVERRILTALPDQLAIVSDGWTVGSKRYFAVFATFSFDDAARYKQFLPGILSLKNEKTQDATEPFFICALRPESS